MGYNLKDAQLKVTRALTASASTVYSTGLDTGDSALADNLAPVEYLLTVPALTSTMAPDTRTFIYSIMTDSTATISGSSTVLFSSVITQTGASSSGAAGTTFRFKLPVDCARYVGVRIVGGTSTGDASSVSATLEVVA